MIISVFFYIFVAVTAIQIIYYLCFSQFAFHKENVQKNNTTLQRKGSDLYVERTLTLAEALGMSSLAPLYFLTPITHSLDSLNRLTRLTHSPSTHLILSLIVLNINVPY